MRPRDLRLRSVLMAGLLGSALLLAACTRESGPTATATGGPRASASPSRAASPSAGQSTAPSSTRPSTAPTSAAPASSAPASQPPPASAPPASAAPATGKKYVVEPGDTLGSIAEQFGVTIQQLIDANRISNPDLLVVGQELIIPGR